MSGDNFSELFSQVSSKSSQWFLSNPEILPFVLKVSDKLSKWDHMYMDIACRVAEESKCPRKKVGCCVLLESGLLATGINGFPSGMQEDWNDGEESNPSVTHAELNAMAKLLEQGVSCRGATVYLTLSPCLECAKLLVGAKVSRVIYKELYRCEEGVDHLKKYGIIVQQYI